MMTIDVTCPNCKQRIQVTQRLSETELRIVEQFARLGVTRYRELAVESGMPYQTAKRGMSSICKKLGVEPIDLLKYWNCELFQEGLRA